ncbi:hypothetical protein EST38_g7915 [Candolleomyces aberdarensis]|uniref:Uncharacterized protein n=1 Tax=Candolleomyces aberdarensis TaxID=2316362 RepID=A0A4Q2DEH2_9AGAR|nr:hypothetical protein EST38_g7915 [Candolleomyces aberdarensis]
MGYLVLTLLDLVLSWDSYLAHDSLVSALRGGALTGAFTCLLHLDGATEPPAVEASQGLLGRIHNVIRFMPYSKVFYALKETHQEELLVSLGRSSTEAVKEMCRRFANSFNLISGISEGGFNADMRMCSNIKVRY